MSEHLHYFSGSERAKQQRFSDARTRFFGPLLPLLTRLRCTPDSLSFLSLLSMAGFVYFLPESIGAAMAFVALHVLLDALDGPLARHQGNASNAGAFTDICVDQAGLAVAVLSLLFYGMLPEFFAAAYLASYLVMIVFLVLLNRLGSPVRFVLRSKYFFYLLIPVEYLVFPGVLPFFLAFFSLYMAVLDCALFLRLKRLM